MSFLVKNDLLESFQSPFFFPFFFGVENEGGTGRRLDETFFAFAPHNDVIMIFIIFIIVVVLFFVFASCLLSFFCFFYHRVW